MTVAFVFPGQGSQTVGMGKALADAFAPARLVFEEVDAALGERLSDTIWNGPAEALVLTENAQPALMAVSLAVMRVLEAEAGVDLARDAAFVAGHSLGEYSALAAAGALSIADAARLLRVRGRAMQKAVPVGVGAMAALVGVDFADGQTDRRRGRRHRRVRRRERQWRRPGRAVRREASGGARGRNRQGARGTTGDDAASIRSLPLFADAPGRGCHGGGAGEGHRQAASRAACRQCAGAANQRARRDRAEPDRAGDRHGALARVGTIHGAAGVGRFYEIGAGRVLAGLIKRIAEGAEASSIGTPDDIARFKAARG